MGVPPMVGAIGINSLQWCAINLSVTGVIMGNTVQIMKRACISDRFLYHIAKPNKIAKARAALVTRATNDKLKSSTTFIPPLLWINSLKMDISMIGTSTYETEPIVRCNFLRLSLIKNGWMINNNTQIVMLIPWA